MVGIKDRVSQLGTHDLLLKALVLRVWWLNTTHMIKKNTERCGVPDQEHYKRIDVTVLNNTFSIYYIPLNNYNTI